MSHWTVGEGRSLAWDYAEARVSEREAAYREWLNRVAHEEREPQATCLRGHPIDGVKKDGRRFCKTCHRDRMNAARRARRSS